ncbi:hypothetical protein D9M72_452770 [compost metagenome]
MTNPDCIAVIVAEHLEFDMARVLQKLFHVELRLAEGAARLLARDRDRIGYIGAIAHDAHAPPAAAAGRLDDDRVTNGLSGGAHGIYVIR